jgi:hypothetical protein
MLDSRAPRILNAALDLSDRNDSASPQLRLAIINMLLRQVLREPVHAAEIRGLYDLLWHQDQEQAA